MVLTAVMRHYSDERYRNGSLLPVTTVKDSGGLHVPFIFITRHKNVARIYFFTYKDMI